MYSRTYTDNFLIELSTDSTQVAFEIDCYLKGNPLGTKYIPFPTARKLTKGLLSEEMASLTRKYDLYTILIPTEERGKSSKEEWQKLEEKRNSLVSKLNAINYLNKEELEKFRDLLSNISNSAFNGLHQGKVYAA